MNHLLFAAAAYPRAAARYFASGRPPPAMAQPAMPRQAPPEMGNGKLIKEYLLKGWDFYRPNLAEGIDHVNRISNFVSITAALVFGLLALDKVKSSSKIKKEVEQVLEMIEVLTEMIGHEKLDGNLGKEEPTKKEAEKEEAEKNEKKNGENLGKEDPTKKEAEAEKDEKNEKKNGEKNEKKLTKKEEEEKK